MLKIRLRREGSRNHPFYRIVVSDARHTPGGPTVAVIGHYNPKTNPPTVHVDLDSYKSWVTKGAHPSDSVASLVVAHVKRSGATA